MSRQEQFIVLSLSDSEGPNLSGDEGQAAVGASSLHAAKGKQRAGSSLAERLSKRGSWEDGTAPAIEGDHEHGQVGSGAWSLKPLAWARSQEAGRLGQLQQQRVGVGRACKVVEGEEAKEIGRAHV